MSHANTTAALLISVLSIVVALRIDTTPPGGIGADSEMPAPTSTTSAPIHQDSSRLRDQLTATVINTETDEQRQIVEWALSRYDEAGLQLPAIAIYAHEDRADCGDKNGYFSTTDHGEYRIHWCGNDYTILHELAHAWAELSLSGDAKTRFMAIADADEWISDNWRLCGSEHSANVIAWGLMDTRINQTRTRPYDHASMLKAYAALTDGGEPLWISG
jgi:hypothetical protein